jgi:hypothetical protein
MDIRVRSSRLAACVLLAAFAFFRPADFRIDAGGRLTEPTSPVKSQPPRLRAVMEEVRRAFRAAGDSFAGGDTTYSSVVDADGSLHISPTVTLPDPDVKKRSRQVRAEALGLTTSGVQRGSNPLRLTPPLATRRADGALDISRGDVTELVRNGDNGVEQSWTFARTVEGQGDLEVHVRVAGETYAGQSAKGLHFTARDGAGIRYGTAT